MVGNLFERSMWKFSVIASGTDQLVELVELRVQPLGERIPFLH